MELVEVYDPTFYLNGSAKSMHRGQGREHGKEARAGRRIWAGERRGPIEWTE